MALYRKSEAMKEQVKELFKKGFAIKKIARALKISKNTVKSILRHSIEKPVTDTVKTESECCIPNKRKVDIPAWAQPVNWGVVGNERRKGVTVKVLHQENAPQISYWAFNRYLSKICPTASTEITMRLEHAPGQYC